MAAQGGAGPVVVQQELEVPECWRPLNVSTRTTEVRYPDLSGYNFSIAKKQFMVAEIQGAHSLLEVTSHSLRRPGGYVTCRGFGKRYNFSHALISKWLKRVERGLALCNDGGRPPLLDSQAIAEAVQLFNAKNRVSDGIFLHQLPALLHTKALDTKKRRGEMVFPSEDVQIGKTSSESLRKKMCVKGRKAQDLSGARTMALQDVRAVYRVACLFDAFSGHLPGEYKLNADATTAIVKKANTGALVCYIPNKEERTQLNKSNLPCELNLLVKWGPTQQARWDLPL
jgi:transposase